MNSHQRPISEIISTILHSREAIQNLDLTRLSDLNDGDFAQLENGWKGIDLEQRLRLISHMVSLSEQDFTLDFTRIFKLCISDPEESIRIRALEGLALEDKYIHVRPIIKTLKLDDSAEVREVSARVLGKFALMAEFGEIPEPIAQDICNALLECLENLGEPVSVRRRALEAIAPFQQELVEHYIEDFYYNDDPKVKASAIYAMGRNCSPRWLSFLIDEMQSNAAEFRYEAAQASGEIEDEEAVPHLLRLIDDEDSNVREAAIMALGKIGGKEAKQALQKLSKSPEPQIKDLAQSALTELLACEDPKSLSF